MIRAVLTNPHVQTVGGYVMRPKTALPWQRERVELPDGDFVDVDHVPSQRGSWGRHALLLHGLEGSSASGYIQVLGGLLAARGLAVHVLNFRGCSGTPNRLPRSYHAGDTADLAEVLSRLQSRQPHAEWVAAGFSLGGNVLLKFLGERGTAAPLSRAAAVSVPFDLGASADALARGVAQVYGRHLLRSLQEKLARRRHALAGRCDLERGLRAHSFREFDDAVTGPLHGFGDAQTYFERCSSARFVSAIRVPTLVVQATDDPFVPGHTTPWAEARVSGHVRLDVTPWGGHVGFVRPRTGGRALGAPRLTDRGAEKRAASGAFLRTILPGLVFEAEERVAAHLCDGWDPRS